MINFYLKWSGTALVLSGILLHNLNIFPLNIIIHPDTPTKEVNKIHVTAWKLGLKSLYYQHSMNAAQKFKQKKECESCEG